MDDVEEVLYRTRTWRESLREYRTNVGRKVKVTLPRVRFLEKAREEERERAA